MSTLYYQITKTKGASFTVGCSEKGVCLAYLGADKPKAKEGWRLVNQATPLTKKATAQLSEFLAGRRQTFHLPLDIDGTPFQKKVWRELSRIPYGKTRTYGEVAKRVGKPKAARAIGLACNRNPLGVIVPCHRVVGSSGKLTGYAGGLDKKERLLQLEGIELSAS